MGCSRRYIYIYIYNQPYCWLENTSLSYKSTSRQRWSTILIYTYSTHLICFFGGWPSTFWVKSSKRWFMWVLGMYIIYYISSQWGEIWSLSNWIRTCFNPSSCDLMLYLMIPYNIISNCLLLLHLSGYINYNISPTWISLKEGDVPSKKLHFGRPKSREVAITMPLLDQIWHETGDYTPAKRKIIWSKPWFFRFQPSIFRGVIPTKKENINFISGCFITSLIVWHPPEKSHQKIRVTERVSMWAEPAVARAEACSTGRAALWVGLLEKETLVLFNYPI